VPRPSSCAALIAVAALALAGCGADEEGAGRGGPTADQQVRTAVATFGIATREKDYQEICDRLLSDELVARIESVGLPCEAALQRGLGDVRAPTLEINEVSIRGARALVSIHTTAAGQEPSDDALQLVREGDAWKIASLAAPAGAPATTTTTPTTTAPAATTPTTTTPPTATATTPRSRTTRKKSG
jgi:hypothetical protein